MKTQTVVKHTPGPWETSKIGNDYDQFSVYTDFRGESESDGYGRSACICNTVYGKANADLVSAAPELLVACERMARFAHSTSGLFSAATIQGIITEMDQAITKATGATL